MHGLSVRDPRCSLQCLLFRGAQPFDILARVSNWVTNRKLKGKKLKSFEEACNFGHSWLSSATCRCMQPMDCWLDKPRRPVSSINPYEIIHCWVLYACLTLWHPKKIDHFGSQFQSMVMVTWLPFGLWHGRPSWRKARETKLLDSQWPGNRKRQDRKWSRFQHPVQYYVLSDPTSYH